MARRYKGGKKRSFGGRKKSVMRSTQFYGKRIKQPVQYFTRTAYSPGYINLLAGGAAVGSAYNFQLGQVPSFTEFTGLYDQYQIKAVKLTLIPRYTEVSLGATQGNMWSVLDQDDSLAPANLDTLLQYQNVKRTRMNQIHSRYIKPSVATEVYATGIASAYAPRRNVWLDCTTAAIEHYGIKFWFDSRVSNTIFDMQVKYYLAFKNVR